MQTSGGGGKLTNRLEQLKLDQLEEACAYVRPAESTSNGIDTNALDAFKEMQEQIDAGELESYRRSDSSKRRGRFTNRIASALQRLSSRW